MEIDVLCSVAVLEIIPCSMLKENVLNPPISNPQDLIYSLVTHSGVVYFLPLVQGRL